jgi:hypothetical protein
MVIFHSYVSLPEGNGGINWKIFPFSHGLWENKKTVAGGFFQANHVTDDTGFFRTDDFRMSKRGPMAQEFRNLNRELQIHPEMHDFMDLHRSLSNFYRIFSCYILLSNLFPSDWIV